MKHKNSGEKPPEFYVLVFLFLLLPSLLFYFLQSPSPKQGGVRGESLYFITTFLPLMM